jgi:hypothetical protein
MWTTQQNQDKIYLLIKFYNHLRLSIGIIVPLSNLKNQKIRLLCRGIYIYFQFTVKKNILKKNVSSKKKKNENILS